MSRALLDVNVLLALLDLDHVDHGRARGWLDAEIDKGWASCAITENGFVRIVSQPRYPQAITLTDAVRRLSGATGGPHHEFWTCSVSALDPTAVDAGRVLGHRQLTDVYLLALAVAHSGRFVTFDQAVPLLAVPGARPEHLVVL